MEAARRTRFARVLLGLELGLGLALTTAPDAGAVAHDPAPRLAWTQRLPVLAGDEPTALAGGPEGRIALGGLRGVRVIDPQGVPETRLRRGPVVDLAFSTDGTLFVATDRELYRVDPDGGAHREAIDRGDDPPVARLSTAAGWVAAATPRGVHVRERGGRWEPLRVVPSSPASLVGFRASGGTLALWCVVEGELWIAGRSTTVDAPWRLLERVPLPIAERDEPAVDLAFDLPGADALLLFPTRLALRDAAGDWSTLRLALPPGARASRIARAFGRLWLATDAGLLSASALGGPWRRAAPPLGSLPVLGLVGGDVLFAATHRDLRSAKPGTPFEVAPGVVALPSAGHAAAVARLHRAALRRQGLLPGDLHDLMRRVRRRGWWPELDVSAGWDEARDRRRDDDQAFISGGMRHLHDREDDRGRQLELAVSLSWDFGDVAFHPEELDALRESRSQIALRDDVLDEVSALYFERLQVLAQREVAVAPAERNALALRAAELAAGLDAWTGGAFSASPSPEAPTVPPGG